MEDNPTPFEWSSYSQYKKNQREPDDCKDNQHSSSAQTESISTPSQPNHEHSIVNCYRKFLHLINRGFSLFIIILYAYYLFILWSSAFSRSTYPYVPIPRVQLGMKDVFLGEWNDITLMIVSIIILVSFIYSMVLTFDGFLVPASGLNTVVLYVASYILNNTDTYTYYYRLSSDFITVKNSCSTLLVITIVHYIIMFLLLPHSKRRMKFD